MQKIYKSIDFYKQNDIIKTEGDSNMKNYTYYSNSFYMLIKEDTKS